MTWGRVYLATLAGIGAGLFNSYGALAASIGVLALLPPRLDPAIRLKEWLGGGR